MSKDNPQARVARDALLNRATWIVDNSIRVACGYEPEIPADLADFGADRDFMPDSKVLSSLLKAVMPVIALEDDRARKTPKTAVDRAQGFLDKYEAGEISIREYRENMNILEACVGMQERKLLTEYITRAK